MTNEQVMIVEDEPLLAQQIAVHLESFGYRVVGIYDYAEQAMRDLDNLQPDIVLMDIMLPGALDGIEAARQIQQRAGIPVVYLTAYDDETTLERAKITEPFGYILKPYSPRELHANIAMALYKSRSEKKLVKAACSTEVFDSLSDALLGIDETGMVKLINHTAASLLGMNRDLLVGKSWDTVLQCRHATEQSLLRDMVQAGVQYAGQADAIEIDLLSGSQTTIPVELRRCAVNKNDSILTSVLVIRDVSERRKAQQELEQYHETLEQRVQERTAELSRINQELDTYNYSVSHDLRAPLRAIDGFSQVLLEDYHDQLDIQAQDYLQRVRGASQRMGELIDDLLLLSRISMENILCEEVNLSDLMVVITDMARGRFPQRDIHFTIEQDLRARGDVRLIRIMLENLIDNAIKFTQHQAVANIEMGQTRINNRQVYYVRDNGVGFDMTFSDRIFHVFQRLHNAAEYDGTGVGLAIVQRIVHKHHGDIWAEGKTGQGACFYFTLDDRPCEVSMLGLAGIEH